MPKYLELLSSGGSEAPHVLLAKLGVDVTDPNFWELGLRCSATWWTGGGAGGAAGADAGTARRASEGLTIIHRLPLGRSIIGRLQPGRRTASGRGRTARCAKDNPKCLIEYLLRRSSLSGLALTAGAAHLPPATVADDGKTVVLDNGVVSLTMTNRGGRGTAIRYTHDGKDVTLAEGKSVLYFDAGGGKAYPIQDADAEVLRKGPDVAEVMWAARPPTASPSTRSCTAFSAAATADSICTPSTITGRARRRAASAKPASSSRGFRGPICSRTTSWTTGARAVPHGESRLESAGRHVAARRRQLLHQVRQQRLPGRPSRPRHGGLWRRNGDDLPSNEFIGGGPFKQELTVHKENTLLAMLVGGHFGAGGLCFAAGEPWDKVYGPVFVYVNNGNPSMRCGRTRRAGRRGGGEMALRVAGKQGLPAGTWTVAGSIRLTDGGSTKDAWVILSPPGEDWTQVLKGYDFWTRADAEGRFKLAKVWPGKYTLRAVGGDQFAEFRQNGVSVEVGKETDPGGPKGGRSRTAGGADIGVATSSHESGAATIYRDYDNFARYAKAFPDDVTFVVGKSKEAEDWNFAQWSVYSKKPVWTIQFDLPEAPKGKATLTIGFTSANPPKGRTTNLQREGQRQGSRGDPPAQDRHGRLPQRQLRTVRITSKPSPSTPGCWRRATTKSRWATPRRSRRPDRKGGVPGEVMYDALRLEVDPDAAPGEARPAAVSPVRGARSPRPLPEHISDEARTSCEKRSAGSACERPERTISMTGKKGAGFTTPKARAAPEHDLSGHGPPPGIAAAVARPAHDPHRLHPGSLTTSAASTLPRVH